MGANLSPVLGGNKIPNQRSANIGLPDSYFIPTYRLTFHVFEIYFAMIVGKRRIQANRTCLCMMKPTSDGHMPTFIMFWHYNDVMMSAMTSQITSLTIVYSTVYSDTNQRKHQSSASLAFVRGIHRWPVNSPHKGPVSRKMIPFDDVIMVI